jgi:hypothetical protein
MSKRTAWADTWPKINKATQSVAYPLAISIFSILIDILIWFQPDADEEENRYIPDRDLLELKEKIEEIEGKKSDIKKGKY